ncbi:hypothetical protein Taro_026630 [Colocasia esculenta]|uniref:Uncharacterized protein n=1 Tax=Colocasia esculenta TaxID=4460 RepID=A0A843VDG1_COLES|nr:hypothetical protein [Colocasia esculenta]
MDSGAEGKMMVKTVALSHLQSSLGWSGTPRPFWSLPCACQSVLLLTASLFLAPDPLKEARSGTVVRSDYGSRVRSVYVSIRVVVTTCRLYGVSDYGVFFVPSLVKLLNSGRVRIGRRRRGDLCYSPSGSPDPWAAAVKIGSSAWAEGRVLGVLTRHIKNALCLRVT